MLTIRSVCYAPANTIHNASSFHVAQSEYPPQAKQSLSKALVYTKFVLLPSMINLRLRGSSNNAMVLPTAYVRLQSELRCVLNLIVC